MDLGRQVLNLHLRNTIVKIPTGTGTHATLLRDHEDRISRIDTGPDGANGEMMDRNPRGTVPGKRRAQQVAAQQQVSTLPRYR